MSESTEELIRELQEQIDSDLMDGNISFDLASDGWDSIFSLYPQAVVMYEHDGYY